MARFGRGASGPPGAGDSLRQVHKSARSEWTRGRRDAVRGALWWAFPAGIAAGVAVALITHRAYFGAGFASLVLLAMADVAFTKPRRLSEAGHRAAGEAATAKALKPLRYLGYTVLHDRRLPPNSTPGASQVDVEHLLVGPAGVFLLDSKNWDSGPRVQFAEKGLYRGLQDQGPVLDRVAGEARTLTGAFGSRLPAGVPVKPALVIHVKEMPSSPRYHKGILIVLPHQLATTVRSMEPVMTAAQAATLATALDRILPPRTGDRLTGV